MKMKQYTRWLLLLICVAMMTALVACTTPLDEKEAPPAQMRCASVAGAPYRLFLPADWNLTTDAGVSGGYYSMNDTAKISAHLYDNTAELTPKAFWTDVMYAEVSDLFGGKLTVDEGDPVDTTIGSQLTLEGDTTVDYTTPAIAVRYNGVLGHIEYRGMSVIASFDKQLLVLTYLAQSDVYDTYLSGMEAAVKHFRWLGTPYMPEEPVNTVAPDAAAPDGMQLASNDDVAYRFYVPESWVINTALPTSSAYCSKEDHSNVSVTVYMPEEDLMTPEQYWEMTLSELKGEDGTQSIIRNMQVLSEQEGELDGCAARTYVYRGDVAGKTYRFSQTIAAYRGMVYVLTYTAADDVFDTHLDAVDEMIAAFDFRGND